MTLIVSQADLHEIHAVYRQSDQNPPKSDEFVTRWKIPELLGQGMGQRFHLRQGLSLLVNDWQLRHDFIERHHPEFSSWIHCGFCVGLEQFRADDVVINPGQYVLWSSGIPESKVHELPAVQQAFWIEIYMMPELLYSFTRNASNELPVAFQHLVKPPEQERSQQIGTITPTMQMALQRILHCPYH